MEPRPIPAAVRSAMPVEAAAERFDCFLSCHDRDKTAVRALASALRERGVSPWLGEERLRPGLPWQPLLEAGIRASRSVAVLVGEAGIGPWEEEAMRAALALAVKDGRPVIPVLLATAPAAPELPLFLSGRTWVDLRLAADAGGPSGLDRLVWGITGSSPVPGSAGSAPGGVPPNPLPESDDPDGDRSRRALADPERSAALAPIRAEIDALLAARDARPDALSPAELTRLAVLDPYLDGTLPLAQFFVIWRAQMPAPAAAGGLDYPALAARLREGKVALVLGPDLGHLCGLGLPRAAELPGRVAAALAVDARPFDKGLAELCEFAELEPDGHGRTGIAQTVCDLAGAAGTPGASPRPDLYGLLAGLELPLVMLSAGYDGLLEAALRRRDRPFVVVSRAPRTAASRDLLLEYQGPRNRRERCGPEALSGLGLLEDGWSVVFKLRGRPRPGEPRDALLISESDYLDYARTLDNETPDYLVSLLQDRHLWFLGYDPRAWEDRLLVATLLRRRLDLRTSRETLVIQDEPDRLARLFWGQQGLGARLVEERFADFVDGLTRALATFQVAP